MFSSSNLAVKIAFVAAIVALCAALINAILVIAIRLYRQFRERRDATLLATWEPLLYGTASGARMSTPKVCPRDLRLFLGLWNHLQESVQGEATKALNEFLIRGGFVPHMLNMLAARNPSTRLIAITAAGHLRDRAAIEPLLKFARDRMPVLSFTAARALLRIDVTHTLPLLLDDILSREDWPIAALAAIFRELGANTITAPLLAIPWHFPPHAARRFLPLLAQAHYEAVAPALRAWLGTVEDPEVLAMAFELLRSRDDLPILAQGAGHANWLVRMATAKALGPLVRKEEQGLLIQLLRDSSWWVRYRAAQALVKLPDMRNEDLLNLRLTIGDRFAADMLAHAMAEPR